MKARVIIPDDVLYFTDDEWHLGIHKEMIKMDGKIVNIEKIDGFYRGNHWSWPPEWLEIIEDGEDEIKLIKIPEITHEMAKLWEGLGTEITSLGVYINNLYANQQTLLRYIKKLEERLGDKSL